MSKEVVKVSCNMKCFGVINILFWITVLVRADDWNYDDADQWTGLCQSGMLQSPIDLVDSETTERIFSAFNFTNYEINSNATVKNNGHTVTITLITTKDTIPTLTGGGLLDPYVLDHFHFHWQSEHTVQGLRYPLEMHLVHHSTRYSDLNSAAAEPGGVAVLGVLFDISIDDDEDFIPLIEVMNAVTRYPDNEVTLLRPIAARSFLPRNTGDYYRYTGSLTTPACNEGVIWTVFHNTLPLSAEQIEHFESVWSADGPLILNYRPIQPSNGRMVHIRGPRRVIGGGGGAAATNTVSAILITIIGILPFISCKFL